MLVVYRKLFLFFQKQQNGIFDEVIELRHHYANTSRDKFSQILVRCLWAIPAKIMKIVKIHLQYSMHKLCVEYCRLCLDVCIFIVDSYFC